MLKLGGWQVEGEIPASGSYVLIAAPHTSNWDFVWTMAIAIVLRVRLSWMGKHTLFKPLIGPLFRRWGGIPIRRRESANRVTEMAAQLRASVSAAEPMVLLVPAEGTRSLAAYWKSGFYHIASAAGVPIVLGFLDYGHRRGGFGPTVLPSGDVGRDMDAVRAFYSDCVGKRPEKMGPIRLKEEEITR
ncbi:MAG: 1-acyl-sn-glycerol-3-phosphate acyltransferase [Gammaproteobacteria bacterium]|nr:1-acyl-sn-glycerol-3-phosphate acyltransferase [Gammaproteobacteria bacterium]